VYLGLEELLVGVGMTISGPFLGWTCATGVTVGTGGAGAAIGIPFCATAGAMMTGTGLVLVCSGWKTITYKGKKVRVKIRVYRRKPERRSGR
jgi:hypothetical protein